MAHLQEGQGWTCADIAKARLEEATAVVWGAYLKSVARNLESACDLSVYLKITDYESQMLMPPLFAIFFDAWRCNENPKKNDHKQKAAQSRFSHHVTLRPLSLGIVDICLEVVT